MMPSSISRYLGYAFDLDGTIYLGDSLIPGADRVVHSLRDSGAEVVFVTNKPIETNADYVRKLNGLGIPAEERDIVSAIDALVLYLTRNALGARVLAVAEAPVIDALRATGFTITEDPAETDVVVVSFDRTFDYDKLNRAYRAIVHHGARIVATNPDPFCPTPEGGLPDCAAMLAAVEACTGARAEAIVGKPSHYMAEAFLARLGVAPADSIMVGDRILTDVAMGLSAGMASALVLSGATTRDELQNSDVTPTYVLEDVTGLLPS